jgi:hypothetical protein
MAAIKSKVIASAVSQGGYAWRSMAIRPPVQRLPDFHGVDVAPPPVNENERSSGSWSPATSLDLHGNSMATSSKERVARYRARQKKGRHVISAEVDDADLREIAPSRLSRGPVDRPGRFKARPSACSCPTPSTGNAVTLSAVNKA